MGRNLFGLFCSLLAAALVAFAVHVTHDVNALWGLVGVVLIAAWFPWEHWSVYETSRIVALGVGAVAIMGVVGYALFLLKDVSALWGLIAVPAYAARLHPDVGRSVQERLARK